MNCKYCGEDLYNKITFNNLFRINYFIHLECEMQINMSSDYFVFPLFDKLVMFDYLFPSQYTSSDEDYLFTRYGYILFERALRNLDWSVILIADIKLDKTTMILVTKLANFKILILNIFNVVFF